MKRKIIIGCLFMMIVSSVLAIPYASMGNINIPDAYVLPHKMIDVGYTNFFVNDGISGAGESYEGYDFATITRFGLLNKAEVGIVYTSYGHVYANAKLRLISETETLPGIAMGVVNLFSGINEEDLKDQDFPQPRELLSNSPFVSISKSIVLVTGISGLNYLETTFHGGIGGRKFQGTGKTVKKFSGLFFGIDIRPSRYFGVDAEFDSQNINLGVNGYVKNLTFRLGIYELESFAGLNDNGTRIALNLGYTFDQFSDLKAAEKRKSVKITQSQKNYQGDTRPRDSYQQMTPTDNPLMEELEQIRKRREQAEKELEEIRKLLQD
ncbi:MAG: hypothetical protein KAS49_01830 [Candidatus Cloacimonetes bacterium]|nr:hypothetical protein [Candidatus Cloacimonadota bacterium]